MVQITENIKSIVGQIINNQDNAIDLLEGMLEAVLFQEHHLEEKLVDTFAQFRLICELSRLFREVEKEKVLRQLKKN